MWWQYFLVFLGSMMVDIVPFPLPPAFTVMIFLQLKFHLDIWWTIILGVLGSIMGRTILTLYIPGVSSKIFNRRKNEDVQYLGNQLKRKGWKGQSVIMIYSLMPLPTTPLFLAGGMARMKPIYMIPPFLVGKVISDAVAVYSGKYAAEGITDLLHGVISIKTIAGLLIGLLLIAALLLIEWRTLLHKKKLVLNFHVWKKYKEQVQH
jgi:uncharacterized membrane protein YdjX (TVP38/TMEM64 family)